jgi:hypothetical protein
MYIGVKVVVGDTLGALIVYPIKGVGNFILEAFGRKNGNSSTEK